MRIETTSAPVRKTVFVERPPEDAFGIFTGGIATWWPLGSHSTAADEETVQADTVVFEPREGGRVYERRSDGTIAYWAEVLVWEPPRRFVLAWQPNPDSPAATELEVSFTAEGRGTRVDLEHRGWERLGDRADAARGEYDSGWDGVLGRYAGASRENGLAIASFVLGIASLVPFLGLLASPFAIAFGIVGRLRSRRGARHGGLATAGIAIGVAALLAWGFLWLLVTPVGHDGESSIVETVPPMVEPSP